MLKDEEVKQEAKCLLRRVIAGLNDWAERRVCARHGIKHLWDTDSLKDASISPSREADELARGGIERLEQHLLRIARGEEA